MPQIFNGIYRAELDKNLGTNTLGRILIKYIVDNFDEEELKKSPKLFSKALLASVYMNRTKSNDKMEMRSIYKRALSTRRLVIIKYHSNRNKCIILFCRLFIKATRRNVRAIKTRITNRNSEGG